MVALNLGCGNDYRESVDGTIWWNVDSGKCKKDFHLEMESFFTSGHWDFQKMDDDEMNSGSGGLNDDIFDFVYACQVLEHISKEKFPDVIRELYRISKPGATWEIAVPYGLSDNFVTDPTHRMPFSKRTFDYFIDGQQLRENGIIYGWGDIRLAHLEPPTIDGNQSIHFKLRVLK